jgi:hypothetical protein
MWMCDIQLTVDDTRRLEAACMKFLRPIHGVTWEVKTFAYNWEKRREIKDCEDSESNVCEECLQIQFHEKRCCRGCTSCKTRFWPTTNKATESVLASTWSVVTQILTGRSMSLSWSATIKGYVLPSTTPICLHTSWHFHTLFLKVDFNIIHQLTHRLFPSSVRVKIMYFWYTAHLVLNLVT